MDAARASSLQVQPCGVIREGLVAADANSRPAVWRVGRVSREGLSAASDTAAGSRLLDKKERRKDGEEASEVTSPSRRKGRAGDQTLNRFYGRSNVSNAKSAIFGFFTPNAGAPEASDNLVGYLSRLSVSVSGALQRQRNLSTSFYFFSSLRWSAHGDQTTHQPSCQE